MSLKLNTRSGYILLLKGWEKWKIPKFPTLYYKIYIENI